MKQIYLTTTSTDGKVICLQAMGRIRDPSLLSDYLSFLFSTVPLQDIHGAAGALSTSPSNRRGLWSFIKENFDGLITKHLGVNVMLLDRFLRLSLNKFSDYETERDIREFFEGRDNRGYDRSLAVISDSIKMRAKYRERDGEVLREWLAVNGYGPKVVGGKSVI